MTLFRAVTILRPLNDISKKNIADFHPFICVHIFGFVV